jgi:hypothetical protein
MSRVRTLTLAVFVIFAIASASVDNVAQQRSIRVRAAPPGSVRTVRTEMRQLHAIAYHQAGLMVTIAIFDDKGRLLESADYLPGGNPDTKSTSTYDKNGNEIEHAVYIHDDLSNRSTTRYDRRNRRVEQLRFDGNGKPRSKFVYKYDKRGRQTAFAIAKDAWFVVTTALVTCLAKHITTRSMAKRVRAGARTSTIEMATCSNTLYILMTYSRSGGLTRLTLAVIRSK